MDIHIHIKSRLMQVKHSDSWTPRTERVFYFIYCVCTNYKCCIMPSRGLDLENKVSWYDNSRGGSRISSWGGAHLKKLRRAQKNIFFPIAKGGANIFGVFRVKNHDFTPKNHIFSNCEGRREHF